MSSSTKQDKNKDGNMPAKSEAQQRFMAMALAAKRGKGKFGKRVMEASKSMSEKQLRDFAKTKHKGLPEKKAYMKAFLEKAASAGYRDLELKGFDAEGTPIIKGKNAKGLIAHLNRNAGKYIGGVGSAGVLAAAAGEGLPFGSFFLSSLPYYLGSAVDNKRQLAHIHEMLKDRKNIQKLFEKKGDYIPSEEEQNTVLQNYLKNKPLQPHHLREKDRINNQVPGDYQLGKYLGTTTPAHVLAGVYGPNLPQEVNKANRYNANTGYPLITPDILNNTRVFESPMAYTTPFEGVTGVNPAEGQAMPGKFTESPNFRDLNIVNGFQPLQPGVGLNTQKSSFLPSSFRKFYTPRPTNAAFPIQHIMEHEVGGHRVYEGGAKQRLPVPLKWPGLIQPYQNAQGEALNGLSAIQRDQFQNTGKRYESPDSFRKDMDNVLNSPDIEKAMNTQGWNRPDAKRLIRSLAPMAPDARESFLNQAGRAIPGMVRNNTNNSSIKTGSYYYDSGDIDSAVDKLKDYFNSDNFRYPETSTDILPGPSTDILPEPSTDFLPEMADVQSEQATGGISPNLIKMLGTGALAYFLSRSNDTEKIKTKKAYVDGFLEKAASYGYSDNAISETVKMAVINRGSFCLNNNQIKTAGTLDKIKEYLKKHEPKPEEKGLKGFIEKQKKGLPQLLKMQRLDRLREIGREMDKASRK